MKLRYLILAVFTLGITLVSCARVDAETEKDKISVVSTVFAPYDFTREIAAGKADVTMLLPPSQESHTYEPTPQDIIKIQRCDIFIYVGGESDWWINGLLESIETDGKQIVTLMDCVELLEEEIVEGMDIGEGHEEDEHEEGGYDEHVWTSPGNAKLIVEKISNALCAADPQNAGEYKENTATYLIKLDELDTAFKDIVNSAKRNTIVFGDRFPFRYFAEAYGLNYAAAFPGCSDGSEPSARTIAYLIDKIEEESIPVVFHIELSNKKIANTLAENTGAKVLCLHSCHNITSDEFKEGRSYLELMNQNVTALREALS